MTETDAEMIELELWCPKENYKPTEVSLLEINPFCEMTDPCLFDHRGNDFDRTLRYVGSDGFVVFQPLES